jgi:uncharacterized membrane protein YidH (DUF202 family)
MSQGSSGIANADKDPRVHLAAERALPAWMRTGLAMTGFGSALIQHACLVREFREGNWNAARPARSGMIVAVVLAIAGLAVATDLTVR